MAEDLISDDGPAPLWFVPEDVDMAALKRTWGSKRLGEVMAAALNSFNRFGSIQAGTAATVFGVSESTIRRWLRDGIPASRQAQIVAAIRPPQGAFVQERNDLRNARDSQQTIAEHPEDARGMWGAKGWLEKWSVAIVKINDMPVRTVRLSRADRNRAGERRLTAGGTLVDIVTFPNWFAAVAARNELLEDVYAYRVQLRNTKLPSGAGKAYLEDAPTKPLTSYRRHPRTSIRPTIKTTA